MEIVLIGDQRIKDIAVRENGEKIVNLVELDSALAFDFHRTHVQNESASIFCVRHTVGEMLMKAQAQLPSGFKLLIKECYRPMSVQKKFWDGYAAFLREKNPSWSDEKIDSENSKFNAPVEVAPHPTGGAIDPIALKAPLLPTPLIFLSPPSSTERY
jgi:D-alanyl-D-alanine dipeptidase